MFRFFPEFSFFLSKFVVNVINPNPLRSQNALGGGGVNLAESIKRFWQTDWNQQHLLSFHGIWNSLATDLLGEVCLFWVFWVFFEDFE